MIIEKNEFRLKFGKAKEGIANWKEMFQIMKSKDAKGMRMLTDLTGHSYTLILEVEHESWNTVDQKFASWAGDAKMGELYKNFIPLCDSSFKTFYKVEESI
jgi:hypothetical protein